MYQDLRRWRAPEEIKIDHFRGAIVGKTPVFLWGEGAAAVSKNLCEYSNHAEIWQWERVQFFRIRNAWVAGSSPARSSEKWLIS